MMIWFRGCSVIVKRRCKDGYTVYITANRYYEVHIKDAKDTDDAMQQALAKYDNGELESYGDEFESAFAESGG